MITSKSVIGEYYTLLEAAQVASYIDLISNYFTSDQSSEDYSWLAQIPIMREWIGGRKATELGEFDYEIKNRKFESTIDIPCDLLRRDKTGQVTVRIGELADEGTRHWEDLLSDLIKAGKTAKCYDGKAFFANNHPGKTAQSNLLTNSDVPALAVTDRTKPTVTEAIDAILGVVGYMQSLKDGKGRPMNAGAKSFLILTAPKLWPYLVHATSGEIAQGGASNVIKELAKQGWSISVVPNAQLTYTYEFDVFRTDGRVKALIRQEEQEPVPQAKAEGSDYEFDYDRHQYGVKAIRNAGYGLWQYAAHATMSNK